ncbi:hypothetical protein LOD99_5801 [Oopsacas minuta]|uniref:Uncharacterized protein n=1 Tax=Oopsacas minuta TaxID=111878 RepID=A0AAV7JQ75_9METZ|nr:hypothetical protein LOD99_5801 [Oopsacas minuta]
MCEEFNFLSHTERRHLLAGIKAQVWEIIPYIEDSDKLFSILSPLSPTEARLLLVYGAGPPSPHSWTTFKQSPWLELLHSLWDGQDKRVDRLIELYDFPPDSPGLSNSCTHLVSPAIALSRSLEVEALDFLLDKYCISIDLHSSKFVISTPLIETVKDCDVMIVHQIMLNLIKRGANVNSVTRELKQSCLHIILTRSRVSKDLFRLLLENGADINLPDAKGNTPLHYIVEKNIYKLFPIITEFVLSGKIELLLLRNNNNFTPLMYAVYESDVKSSLFLLEHCELSVATVRQNRYLYIISSEKKYIYRKKMRRTLLCCIKHGLGTGSIDHGYLKDEFCDAEKLSDIDPLTETAVRLLINSYFYRDVSVGMPNPVLDMEMRRTCKRVCNRKYRKYNLGVANLTPIHQLTACCLQLFMDPYPGLNKCSILSEYFVHKMDISRELYALIKVSSQFVDQTVFDTMHPIVSEYFEVNILNLINHPLSLVCNAWEELITVSITYLWLCYEHVALFAETKEILYEYIFRIIHKFHTFAGRKHSLISSIIIALSSPKLDLCVNLKGIVKITPIILVDFLMEFGASLNTRGCDGTTPLHLASVYKNQELVQYLLERNADPSALDYLQDSCVSYFAVFDIEYSLPRISTLKILSRDTVLRNKLNYKQFYMENLSEKNFTNILEFINLSRPYMELIN